MSNKFYRYESVQYAVIDVHGELVAPKIPNPVLELREYNLHKETPKGYWISYGTLLGTNLRSNCRWVSKRARKRHAYPTKEEALENFIKRNEKRIKILSYQIEICQMVLYDARYLKTKIENENKTNNIF